MVGFYCGTQFHIFESVFLKKLYFPADEAVMFIVSPLEIKNYSVDCFFELGFSKVVEINSQHPFAPLENEFEYMFFFSICTHHPDYLKNLKKKKLILAYDGITTFMLKHWSATTYDKRFDYDTDISEFWMPSTDLLLDQEYKDKCVEFNFNLSRFRDDDLRAICSILNKIFRYEYAPVRYKTVFMDRYLTRFSNVFFDASIEKVLTQAVYYSYGEKISIKRHPYDLYYKHKYAGLEGADVIEDDVPWELVYLNSYTSGDSYMPSTYIIYNSFAPANLALLFGDNDFNMICIQPILDRYSLIKDSYLNADITLQILEKFSKINKVDLLTVDSFSALRKREKSFSLGSAKDIWLDFIDTIKQNDFIDVKSILAFRLFLEGILEFKNKSSIYYYLENKIYSNSDMQKAIIAILNKCKYNLVQSDNSSSADLIIEIGCDFDEYARQDYDIRQGKLIIVSMKKVIERIDLYELMKGRQDLYIWGATGSNRETLEFIERMSLRERVRYIFDENVTGEKEGIAITRFRKELISPKSLIIICARIAYSEIEKILVENGLRRDRDYVYGIGIGR